LLTLVICVVDASAGASALMQSVFFSPNELPARPLGLSYASSDLIASHVAGLTLSTSLSKAQCERIAEQLGCAYYYADVDDWAEQLQAWVEQGGLIVATLALGTGVDFLGIVYILHVGMLWSMTDFAQASGCGGRGGERVDVVVVLEEGEVEKRMEKESDDINVQVIGQFLIGSGC
jgi:superfamily II DNA helicase RecQ